MERIIHSGDLPPAKGPYSLAVIGDPNTVPVKLSGNIGINEKGELVKGGLGPEMRQAMTNVKNALSTLALGLTDITDVTIYVTDLDNKHGLDHRVPDRFAKVNAVYAKFFPENGPFPARTTVGVEALPLGAQVEITANAQMPRPAREEF